MPRIVLITGSRSWPEQHLDVIARALSTHMLRGDTLRHGAAEADPELPGVNVDEVAAAMWAPYGPLDPHPAKDHPSPLARNLHMINLQPVPVICLALATRWASGTGHCARHARKAGIYTVDFGVDTRAEARSTAEF